MVMSLPSWECGLKLRKEEKVLLHLIVTPFVGVWIEISSLALSLLPRFRHSLRGSVDWNWPTSATNSFPFVTPFVGVWIEICIHITQLTPKECHSLRGSVDWNSFGEQLYSNKVGHSLRGSVDWNSAQTFADVFDDCHSLRGSVDWNYVVDDELKGHIGHSLRGSVVWNYLLIS